MSDSATPWTVAHQAPLCMGFPRQEYWSRSRFPSPGDLPNSGMEPTSPESPVLAGRFFTIDPPGKPMGKCRRREKPLCLAQSVGLSQTSYEMHLHTVCSGKNGKSIYPWLLSLINQGWLQGMLTPPHFWITHELFPPASYKMSHSMVSE